MIFDNEYYNQVKRFTDHSINFLDFRIVDKYKGKPFEWAKTFLPLISDCVHREDWEGAKAMTDSIRDFLNKFLPESEKITEEDTLKLPEFKQKKINGIICFVDGTAEFFNKKNI